LFCFFYWVVVGVCAKHSVQTTTVLPIDTLIGKFWYTGNPGDKPKSVWNFIPHLQAV
jgi:hypothetical protein